MISESALVKYYKTNQITRTLFNMEYQHLKAHNYAKISINDYHFFPGSYIFNSLHVTACEGLATNSVYVFEDLIIGKKPCLKSILRNLKVYLLLNSYSIAFMMLDIQPEYHTFTMEYVGSVKLFEVVVYFVLFFATCDKVQLTFKEKNILSYFEINRLSLVKLVLKFQKHVSKFKNLKAILKVGKDAALT